MAGFSICFALGAFLLQQQAALPSLAWAWTTALLLMPLLWPQHWPGALMLRLVAWAALGLALGFFYAAAFAQHRLADQLDAGWQGRDIELSGVVAELPRQRENGLSFAFDVEQVLTPGAHVPAHLLLSTYNSDKQTLAVQAGERWHFRVRLKQPHGTANPYGFDFEGWLLERDLRATGYVRADPDNLRLDALAGGVGYAIEHLREAVRARFQRVLGEAPAGGVLTALAIGDQSSITSEQWQVFTRTGVNHLMSISGLHITMFATLAFALTYALWRRSPRLAQALPARKAAVLAGLLLALGYALMSGFSIPAQRTIVMLAGAGAALLLSRRVAPSQVMGLALLAVLLADPWAVLSPGFWLSFGAVALILYISANRLARPHWLAEYGRVQWAMLLGLIPPLLALFQQVSLVAPVANAFAIPVVSLLVAPLAVLGAAVPVDSLLWLAHGVLAVCIDALEWLARLPEAVWQQHAPPVWAIVLGMVGVLWLLLPRGFPARWLGLFLLLPLLLMKPEIPAAGAARLVVFDVGQGLAVLVQTHGHALLYDAGPDYPGAADSGSRILVPSLRAQGISRLDGLMLTHDDADHTGGALSVLEALPTVWLNSSLPEQSPIVQHMHGGLHCMDGQSWDWEGVHFEVLQPARDSYADRRLSKNDRGCTLRITTGRHSVLLAADIERKAEQRLLRQHPDKLAATLLVVPHHGSKTSSTEAFVAAVHPQYAVFTAGYRNRFHHPSPQVVERYRAIGSTLLRSDVDGAVEVEMDGRKFRVQRWRHQHVRYWQQGEP